MSDQRFSLKNIEARLKEHRPRKISANLAKHRAAVAAVLRFTSGEAEVLLMKRAIFEGDRWSGQISMPGGRQEAADGSTFETALRETREEMGLDLGECASSLGALDEIMAVAKGRLLPMSISPHVFALHRQVEITLSEEATDFFWLPLHLAASGALDGVHRYQMGPAHIDLPCWTYAEAVIWGLTHKMIRAIITLLEA